MDERNSFAFDRIWRNRTDRRAFLLGGLAVVGAGAFTRIQAQPRDPVRAPVGSLQSGNPARRRISLSRPAKVAAAHEIRSDPIFLS